MKKKSLLIIFLLCFKFSVKAQEYLGINFPSTLTEQNKKCNNLTRTFRQLPKEVKFSIRREGNKLFFNTNDKNLFSQVFKNSGDGIAVDVVPKSRYDCINEVEESQIRGVLLKPVFAQKLLRSFKKSTITNSYKTFVGTIPLELQNEELEFNILFLSNRTFCRYQTTYNLESFPWDLLDMGVYLDSLTYKSRKITNSKDKFQTKYKTLKFVIPFEKNKAEYSPKDIKPLYDSLKLTDFNIKKINIKAYSSIEGLSLIHI